MNERLSLPGLSHPFQRLGWGICLINSGPTDSSRATEQHRPRREGDVILMRHMLAPDCSGCRVTLGESPHLSGPAEGMPGSCTLRAGVRSQRPRVHRGLAQSLV